MKQFLVILGLTAILWVGVSMSEQHQYPIAVSIHVTGYDTVRYALVQADTNLVLQVRSDGFSALAHTVSHHRLTATVDLASDGGLIRSLAVADLLADFKSQLGYSGSAQLTASKDSLRYLLKPRGYKILTPSLDQVQFSFAEQCGLYGEATIEPAEVYLYGSDEALSHITSLPIAPCTIDGISQSSTFELPLQPVWEQWGDIYPSTTKVSVSLPVTQYVEHKYRIPVRVDGADTSIHFRIYPQEVTLRVWVPQQDLSRISASQFDIAADYSDILSATENVQVHLTRFPSTVRPRTIEPTTVQCIIIQ